MADNIPTTNQADVSRFTLNSKDPAKMVRKAIKNAKGIRNKWLKVANSGDDFFAGHQWAEEDMEILRSQGRTTITFNRVMKTIMLISGVEINHRQDPLAIPRNPTLPGQKELASLTTTYLRWVLDECEGDEERTQAFIHLLCRGMGWVELSLAYDQNPDGVIWLKRVDGKECWWDTAAKEQNLNDARWVAHRRFMPYEEIMMLYGAEKADELTSDDHDPDEEPELWENVSPIGYAPGNGPARPEAKHEGPFLVTKFQWWEWEDYYRTVDPESVDPQKPDSGKIIEIPAKKWKQFEKYAAAKGKPNPVGYKNWKRRYKQTVTSGDVELDTIDLPVPDFTLMCMTGLYDAKNHIWFGAVKVMEDPQQWSNKCLSTTQDILSRSRKNLLLVEKNAVEDPRKFERDVNSTGGIVIANRLDGIKEMTSTQLPPTLPLLLQQSVSAIPDVSGVNVELLGQSEGDQPGVTTQYRQTQGLTVLGPFFNAERRHRIKESKLLIEYGRIFIADGRLMRLGSAEDAPAIPLFRDKMASDYDLILDENPRNPNMKMAMWTELIPVLQIAIKAGLFGLIAKIFEYSPYPTSIVKEIQKELMGLEQQKQQNPFANQKGGKGAPPNPMLDMAKIEKYKTASMVDLARARALDAAAKLKGATVGMDLAERISKAHRDTAEHAQSMAHKHQTARNEHEGHIVDQFDQILTSLTRNSGQETQPQA